MAIEPLSDFRRWSHVRSQPLSDTVFRERQRVSSVSIPAVAQADLRMKQRQKRELVLHTAHSRRCLIRSLRHLLLPTAANDQKFAFDGAASDSESLGDLVGVVVLQGELRDLAQNAVIECVQ